AEWIEAGEPGYAEAGNAGGCNGRFGFRCERCRRYSGQSRLLHKHYRLAFRTGTRVFAPRTIMLIGAFAFRCSGRMIEVVSTSGGTITRRSAWSTRPVSTSSLLSMTGPQASCY